jgi:hypothetical protein
MERQSLALQVVLVEQSAVHWETLAMQDRWSSRLGRRWDQDSRQLRQVSPEHDRLCGRVLVLISPQLTPP